MIKALAHIWMICWMLLSPAICMAQRNPVRHTFHSDSGDPSKLRFANGNKTGVTPLLTYTCSNNATFGTYTDKITGLSIVSLNLPGKDDFVTTTAVDSLRGVTIGFYPNTDKRHDVKLQLSRDSIHWSDSIVSDLMYNSAGSIRATFVPGRYYVRIKNSTIKKKPVSLWYIEYLFGDCNCVLYIPEE